MVIGFEWSTPFQIESIIQRPVFTWEGEHRLNTMTTRDVAGTRTQDQELAAEHAQDHMTEVKNNKNKIFFF